MTVRRSSDLRSRALVVPMVVLALFGAAACSNDSDDATTTSTTTAPTDTSADPTTDTRDPEDEEVLTILVSNDDGVGAPGIATLVDALAAMPATEVIVVAPTEQQSGTGGSTTDGELSAGAATTASGVEATAVDGFPADSVNWALDGGIDQTPDLVITGINSTQNVGALGDQVSGTIGAARAAAAKGIPALATSLGLPESEEADHYDVAAAFVVEWVEEHRAALLAGELSGETVLLVNLNVPTCETGEPRGVVEVPMAEISDGALDPQDCESTLTDPADDITALNNGFVTLSELTLEPAPAA